MMDKIILVFYMNCDQIPDVDVSRYMNMVGKTLHSTEPGVRNYFLPVRNQETRVDCINPKLISADEFKEIDDLLKRLQTVVDNLLTDFTNENNKE